VELDAVDIAPGYGRREGQAVVAGRQHVGGVGRGADVAVDEVDVVAGGDPGQQRRFPDGLELVPAHVRDLQAGQRREADDAPGQQAQPAMLAQLLAGLKEELHPQADAQQGRAARHFFPDGRLKAQRPQAVDARSEGAHARQDDPLCARQIARPGGHAGRHAQVIEGVEHAAQVAGPVVDDRDHAGRRALHMDGFDGIVHNLQVRAVLLNPAHGVLQHLLGVAGAGADGGQPDRAGLPHIVQVDLRRRDVELLVQPGHQALEHAALLLERVDAR